MKRGQRLKPLHDLASQSERSLAVQLRDSERRVIENEQRHQELLGYRSEYEQLFRARARGGAPMGALRDQQGFIARLSEAVSAQLVLLANLRAQSAALRLQWRSAATAKQVMGKVIDVVRMEESMRLEKHLQKETDELARPLNPLPRTGP